MATRFFPNYDRYIITSRFGMRTLKGETRMHNGIDLVATNDGKTGQVDDIKAHTGGTVSAVGYGSSAGNYIKIKVADGAIMVYYHLKSKPAFKVGDKIEKGQIVGRMGKTGNVTGAHLHWGIQKDGKWIDPEPYLDKDYIKEGKTVKIEMNVLTRGAKGEQVKTLQRLLLALGYKMESNGKVYGVDGSFGGATEKTVCAFQKAEGLPVNGRVDSAEWNKLLKG